MLLFIVCLPAGICHPVTHAAGRVCEPQPQPSDRADPEAPRHEDGPSAQSGAEQHQAGMVQRGEAVALAARPRGAAS